MGSNSGFKELISDACAQIRRDEILPSVGIIRGRIPAPASTSPTLPKTLLTDFGDIILSKWVMIYICYALLTFYDRKRQVNDHICTMWMSSSFKITREISINKFKISNFQVRLCTRNLIKRFAIPLCTCTCISIWSYKLCCGQPKFCKAIKQCVHLTPTYQTQSQHPSSRPRSAGTWILSFPIGRI